MISGRDIGGEFRRTFTFALAAELCMVWRLDFVFGAALLQFSVDLEELVHSRFGDSYFDLEFCELLLNSLDGFNVFVVD